MYRGIQNKVGGLLQGSRNLGLVPLFIFNQLGRLIDS